MASGLGGAVSHFLMQGLEFATHRPEFSTQHSELIAQRADLHTPGPELVTYPAALSTQRPELTAHRAELPTQGSELVAHRAELPTQGSELVAQRPELVTQRPELAIEIFAEGSQHLLEVSAGLGVHSRTLASARVRFKCPASDTAAPAMCGRRRRSLRAHRLAASPPERWSAPGAASLRGACRFRSSRRNPPFARGIPWP